MRTGLVLASLLSSATAFAADPPPKPGAFALCNQIIDLKAAQVGSSLGPKVGPMTFVNDGFCWQAFTKGRIHTGTLTSSVTVVITGSVLAKFAGLGYEAGFGQAFAPINDPNGVVRHPYKQGFIVVHPSFGTRGIKNPLAALWNDNNTTARFGYPTSDLLPTPNGGYNMLERGYVARTNEMGSWIDFTGGGEGKVLAKVNLYQDWYFGPTNTPPLTKYLAGESPVSLRTQLGSFDEKITSLTLNAPTRTSLYLYDESPLEGRYTRITGADQSKIQIQALGTWMNDKPSSMVLVNHGSVSFPTTTATLATAFKTSMTAIDTRALMNLMHEPHIEDSWLWFNTVTVTPLPGERAFQVERDAQIKLGPCLWDVIRGDVCDAVGNVRFTVLVRPTLAMDAGSPTVKFEFADGVATSLGCSGRVCDERNDALDILFDRSDVQRLFTDALEASIRADLRGIANQVSCPGLESRRANVLPDKLEIVMGDTIDQATCAIRSQWSFRFDATRPTAQITNHNADGSAAIQFNGIYNVVPDYSIILPPPVFN